MVVSDALIYRIAGKRVDGWEFCKFVYSPSKDEVETRAYKGKCNHLLAQLTGKSLDAVKKWGVKFKDMPDDEKVKLQYVSSLVKVVREVSKDRQVAELVREVIERDLTLRKQTEEEADQKN